MNSKAGSSIGAFLLSLPVSTLLMMMIFGVPRFAPGTNGESGWDSARQFLSQLRGETASAEGDVFREYPPGSERSNSDDPFAPQGSRAEAPRWGDAPPPVKSLAGPAVGEWRNADAEPHSAWPFSGGAAAGPRPQREGSAGPSAPNLSGNVTTPVVNPPAISWTEARQRLAELGIDQFHLEPGLERDHYLFVCLFTPGDDPRVTHRFEAEANEPLAAVQQVLAQIETWLSQRYAERSRNVLQPAGSR